MYNLGVQHLKVIAVPHPEGSLDLFVGKFGKSIGWPVRETVFQGNIVQYAGAPLVDGIRDVAEGVIPLPAIIPFVRGAKILDELAYTIESGADKVIGLLPV